jgi:ATP-dependent Clp protease ATP-binding subunit ClpX
MEGARRGIVYLDGVDDPGVQDRLLEVFRGRADDLLPRELQMDLTALLFVGGGLFAGLDKARREPESPRSAADLVAYGMVPELAQRFQVIVTLGALDEDALARLVAVVDLKHFSGWDRER